MVERKNKKQIEGVHPCPPGQHWVKFHKRRGRYGNGTVYVQGHCVKNGFTLTKKTTELEIGVPLLGHIKETIEEQPISDEYDENDTES